MVNIKEAQTRKDLIDPKLAEAGWDTSNQYLKGELHKDVAGKISKEKGWRVSLGRRKGDE